MNNAVGARLKFREDFQKSARSRLRGLSDSFIGLARGFEQTIISKKQLDSEDEEHIIERLWRQVCCSCVCCDECWEREADNTYNSISRLIRTNTDVSDMNNPPVAEFSKRCVINDSFFSELKHELIFARKQLGWYNRMTESRVAVADQLKEVGRILSEFSEEIYKSGEIIEIKKWVVVSRLLKIGVRAKNIYMFKKGDRGMELHIRAKCIRNGSIPVRDVAGILSRSLECRFIPRDGSNRIINGEYRDYCFCEDVSYHIISGVARRAKNDGEVSGDNFSFINSENGNMLMLLSDGMGSGKAAGKESTFVIELLEQLLTTGFREESAVRLLNSVMVVKNEDTMLSTVDMAVINLYTGMCELIKLGAAVTYIKRGNRVECISGEALPLGAASDTSYSTSKCKLFDGDYVIMVSDGVAECPGGVDCNTVLMDIICKTKSTNPQELANEIMEKVCGMKPGEPVDDMTILVSGIWKKHVSKG